VVGALWWDRAWGDRDPFAVPPEEIAATRVQSFVEGRRVHAAGDG
jgi:hypothetical protein